MDQPRFTGYFCKELMAAFLESLWKKCKERFTEKAMNEFGGVLGCIFSDPGFDDDFRESYAYTFGKQYSDDLLLTENEAFTLIIEYCAKYIYDCSYDISEVLHLLFLVRYQPKDAQKEKTLWKETIRELSKTLE